MAWWKRLLLGAGGLVALQAVFFGALVAGAAVPDGPILHQLAADVRSGTYGPAGLKDRMGTSSDSFTECVVVGTGLGKPQLSPLQRAGEMPRISNCEKGSQQILALDSGQQVQGGPYFRYWAGYTVFTRPVLAVVGMEGLRIVSGALLLGSFLALFLAVARSCGRWAAGGLIAPVVLASNLMSTPSTSFSQAVSISAYIFGGAVVAWAARRSVWWALAATAFAAGLFCFMDLLTTPGAAWALTAGVVTAVTWARTRELRATIFAMLGAGLVWPVAFTVTWVSRWVLAMPFMGYDATVSEVKDMVLFRTEGKFEGVSDALWAPTAHNWDYWQSNVPTAHVVLIGALVVAALALLVSLRNGIAAPAAAALVAFTVLTVPFWYQVLRNHSQIHSFFTYRSLPIALGVVLLGCLTAAHRGPIESGTWTKWFSRRTTQSTASTTEPHSP